MEIKALFFYILVNFNIEAYDKTDIPIKIAKAAANWSTENGIHLELKPRNWMRLMIFVLCPLCIDYCIH